MNKNTIIALIFPNTHYAMEAEDILTKSKLNPSFLALPGSLGLGCGTAVTVHMGVEKQAFTVLKKNNVSILSVWIVAEDDKPWIKY